MYITRDGEIVDIMIGTHQDVELTGLSSAPQQQAPELRPLHPYAPQRHGLSQRRGHQRPALLPLRRHDGHRRAGRWQAAGLVQTAFLGEKVHGENQVLSTGSPALRPHSAGPVDGTASRTRIAAVLRGEDAECARREGGAGRAHGHRKRGIPGGAVAAWRRPPGAQVVAAYRAEAGQAGRRPVHRPRAGRRSLRGNVRRLRRTSASLTRNCPVFRCAIWRSCCG